MQSPEPSNQPQKPKSFRLTMGKLGCLGIGLLATLGFIGLITINSCSIQSTSSSSSSGTTFSQTQVWINNGTDDTNAWANSSGSVVDGSNSFRMTVPETSAIGSGSGSMKQLSGSTFIQVRLDVDPEITVPVAVKLSLTVTQGQVNVSFVTPDRTIVSASATPDSAAELTGISEIQSNTLSIKLEAIGDTVGGIHYQLAFEPA